MKTSTSRASTNREELQVISEDPQPEEPQETKTPTLKFTNYDLIGIDLDHTIARYNLERLFRTHHDFMVKYLKRHKRGYRQLTLRLTENEIDFLARGLFIDPERGNVLKASKNGTIVQASHGLQELTNQEIVQAYGVERKWTPINNFIDNSIETWSKGWMSGTKALLDYTDLAVSLVFAKAVSSRYSHKQSTWSDVIESAAAMYDPTSCFSHHFRRNKDYFIIRSDRKVRDWLISLRKHSQVALITSAHAVSAKTTMQQALGPNYTDCFDIFIYDACKPWFFLESRPFFTLNGEPTSFFGRGEYSKGCSRHVESYLTEGLARRPRLLYIGDSPINDIIAPSMDVIAIVEELTPEGFFPGSHPHSNFISSSFWGSYFYAGANPSVFGDIIFEQSLFAAPSLEYFADYPTNHEFSPFWLERKGPSCSYVKGPARKKTSRRPN